MSTTKKFPLKLSVLMIGTVLTAMLSACQSAKPSTQAQTAIAETVIPATASVRFENSGQSPATLAKGQLLQALNEHLAKERYTLTEMYSQSVPLYNKDSKETTTQSFWSSVMKVSEYKRNQSSSRYATSDAYRSMDDYLYESMSVVQSDVPDAVPMTAAEEAAAAAEVGAAAIAKESLGELPYLRYDDEMAGRTPKTISRQEAMSDEDYQSVQSSITDLEYEVRSCVSSAALDLDTAVSRNSSVDSNDAEVKTTLKTLDSCKKSADKTAATLQKKARGYQLDEIKQAQSCLGKYQQGIKEIMNPNRTPKELSGDAHDAYDSVWQNFRMCQNYGDINRTLSPLEYVSKEHSQTLLDNTSAIKTCLLTAQAEQDALRKAGKTYLHHAEAYQESHDHYVMCALNVLDADNDLDTEDYDSLSDARYRVANYVQYQSDEGNYDDYYKYRGASGWLKAYREMQANNGKGDIADAADPESSPMGRFGFFGSMVSAFLDHAKKTPEQLQASNLYQYNHTKFTSLSHHNPQTGQVNLLWSLDFESPTARQSAKVPVQMDFEKGVVRTDVSALLPIFAIVDPENAPLPDEVNDGRVLFKLPDELAQKIPSRVIYNAISQGIVAGFKELPSERFTPVAMEHDRFAKEVGATNVIKLDLGAKELGSLTAHIAKAVAADLKRYVDDNPQLYPDTIAEKSDKYNGIKKGDNQADKVKRLIDDFATLSTTYRSRDIGGLAQMLEGIIPFELDNVMYAYLDKDGKLIASQNVSSINDDLRDVQLQNVTQSYYGQDKVKGHTLAAEFTTFGDQSFMDGGQWIKDKWDEQKFLRDARYARYDYEYSSDSDNLSQANVSEAMTVCENPRDERKPVPRATTASIGDESAQATIDAFLQKECPN